MGSLGCKQIDEQIYALHQCRSFRPATRVTLWERLHIMDQVAGLPFNMLSHQTVLLLLSRNTDLKACREAERCHCFSLCQGGHQRCWARPVTFIQVTDLLAHLLPLSGCPPFEVANSKHVSNRTATCAVACIMYDVHSSACWRSHAAAMAAAGPTLGPDTNVAVSSILCTVL